MSNALVWLNGQLVKQEEAVVSAISPGLLVAKGLFETMAVYEGKVFEFGRHYRRLEQGCERLGFVSPTMDVLEAVMTELLRDNALLHGRARVRITLFEGPLKMETLVQATAVEPSEGASRMLVSPYRRNERGALTGIKATAYAENILALREARQQGADEVVILNSRDEVCEGGTTNIFCVENDVVLTSPLSSGCLPGVTREIVMELCQDRGMPVREEALSLERLLKSDGVFLTGSLREVQAVESIGERTWGKHSLVDQISGAYQSYVRDYIDGAE
ncbi:branched-chain-amino-acid aminotransferase [Rubritalea halochordaticola]|uniref:branched-chain-amino-acid transaminase n=1 Tax=Rubritalea halochordaticola TaxID=714537 RepID=A0ABP9UWQ2_9BACT